MQHFSVTYHAKEQFDRLSSREKRDLTLLLSSLTVQDQARRIESSDKFVSRLGDNKRVVWKRLEDGKILVLSVVTRSNSL